jgi:toxin ParE1/3/4
VAEYRLTVRARAELLDIYAFSEARFGRYQAEAYHAGFERTLVFWPISPASAWPSTRSRRAIVAFASVTAETGHVLIRALVHVRQDLRGALFE